MHLLANARAIAPMNGRDQVRDDFIYARWLQVRECEKAIPHIIGPSDSSSSSSVISGPETLAATRSLVSEEEGVAGGEVRGGGGRSSTLGGLESEGVGDGRSRAEAEEEVPRNSSRGQENNNQERWLERDIPPETKCTVYFTCFWNIPQLLAIICLCALVPEQFLPSSCGAPLGVWVISHSALIASCSYISVRVFHCMQSAGCTEHNWRQVMRDNDEFQRYHLFHHIFYMLKFCSFLVGMWSLSSSP